MFGLYIPVWIVCYAYHTIFLIVILPHPCPFLCVCSNKPTFEVATPNTKDTSYEDDLYADDDEEVVTPTITKKTNVMNPKEKQDDLFGEKKGGLGHDPAQNPTTTPSTTTTTVAAAVPKVTKSYDDDDNGDDFDDYNDDFDDLDHIEMGEDIVSPTKGTDPLVDKATEEEIAALQRELEELEHQEVLLAKQLSMR